jgi:plasmid stabilization system protein ParE
VCCGTKRRVEINCPPSCPYLSSSKAHPPAVAQKRQERDLAFLLPFWADLNEAQYRLLLLLQAVTLKHAAGALLPLRDEDVAEAAAVTAATLETAGRGIIYEHQATSVPAQRLANDLREAFDELVRQAGGTPPPRLEHDTAVALRRIEQTARKAAQALPGDEAPVFLKLIGRVLRQTEMSPDAESGSKSPEEPSSRLIIPG